MRLLFALALLVLALLLAGFLLLVRPAWSATHCTTYEEKTLGRWQTLCTAPAPSAPGTGRTLERWDTTITPPPGQTCEGRFNPRTRQWEGRCR